MSQFLDLMAFLLVFSLFISFPYSVVAVVGFLHRAGIRSMGYIVRYLLGEGPLSRAARLGKCGNDASRAGHDALRGETTKKLFH